MRKSSTIRMLGGIAVCCLLALIEPFCFACDCSAPPPEAATLSLVTLKEIEIGAEGSPDKVVSTLADGGPVWGQYCEDTFSLWAFDQDLILLTCNEDWQQGLAVQKEGIK